jgi:hypothetical protein
MVLRIQFPPKKLESYCSTEVKKLLPEGANSVDKLLNSDNFLIDHLGSSQSAAMTILSV